MVSAIVQKKCGFLCVSAASFDGIEELLLNLCHNHFKR